MKFDNDVSAPRRARRALEPMFPNDGPIADDVTLVASELVANVVRHTEHGGEMRAWHDEVVRLEVHDDDPRIPKLPSTTPPDAEIGNDGGGRGLSIVGQLADEWGTDVEPIGKTVWAEFGPRPD